eukprot:Phypoly_transcript_16616.p1 GENE.Phypoly_transcript_16616~~Phypoly_transcript_16616.p1  ORF type:complete len:162 (+),score=18.17 Phypoly_transcript_16616:271-756(+)
MSSDTKQQQPYPEATNPYPYPTTSLGPNSAQPSTSSPPQPTPYIQYQGYQGYQASYPQGQQGYAPLYGTQPGYSAQYGQPYQPTYPPPATVVTYETRGYGYGNGIGIGWILFIVGWFVPICWLFGAVFTCVGSPRERAAGRANLICATIFILLIILVLWVD